MAKKTKELSELSVDELATRRRELKEEALNLRVQKESGQRTKVRDHACGRCVMVVSGLALALLATPASADVVQSPPDDCPSGAIGPALSGTLEPTADAQHYIDLEGSYDVGIVTRKLREIGYTGSIGFQGYGIKLPAHDLLTRTMNGWRALHATP